MQQHTTQHIYPDTPPPLLAVNALTIQLPQQSGNDPQYHTVVQHVSFTLEKGRTLALVGESGSGKSLTAKAILQLLPLSARVDTHSRIFFKGEEMLCAPERYMRTKRGHIISLIFQDALCALNPVMRIAQQLQELLPHRDAHTVRTQIAARLHEVGIADPERCMQSYPHQLSGGMRQRAMIAMALMAEPDLIIADEPTTALDVTLQAQIIQLLKQLQQKRQMGLLFISHDLAVVSQIADDIIVMRKGQVVEKNSVRAFFHAPQSEYSHQLLDAIPLLTPRMRTAVPSDPASPPPSPALSIKNLSIQYPDKPHPITVLHDLSLTLYPHETLALVGESGSGKSTLAKAILQDLTPTQGQIHFPLRTKKQEKDVQMVFQDPYTAMNPRWRVATILAEGIALHHPTLSYAQREKKIMDLLEQVELPHDYQHRYPHTLSGGEKQRICIARVLAATPRILICDEPTSALDVSIQIHILQLLERLQNEHGFAILLITHNIGVVAHLAHRTAVLHKGRIVESGLTHTVLTCPQHPYTKTLLRAVPRLQLKGETG